MAGGFEIFECSIGKDDPELDGVVSFLARGLRQSLSHSVAIVRMNPLQHSFTVGGTLQRVKTQNSVGFLREVDRPCGVKDRGAGMAQPLCFGQIGFAASECLFALFRSVMCRPTPR